MDSYGKTSISPVDLSRVCVAVRRALVGGMLLGMVAPAVQAELPVQCRGNCGASGLQWLGMGDVAQPRLEDSTLIIEQRSDQAILNWQSFNIGRNDAVRFDQPDASAVTLNRIFQGSPSQILGRLSADGQIYLVNPNGVVFGEGAQVDVRSLVTSTLEITDTVFEDGILNAILSKGVDAERAAFVSNGQTLVVDASGAPVLFAVDENGTALRDANGFLMADPLNGQPMTVNITLESGAVVKTKSGGSVLMFAPEINNRGEIRTPDGQTILAAGDKVYLQSSDDPQLRGLLVEVDNGGSVTNMGSIIAERGNISLLGMAVNQQGLLRATTSVNVNGSIRLLARDTVSIIDSAGGLSVDINTTRTGDLVLGEDSRTEILAELDSAETAVDDQQQYASRVELMGRSIHLQTNSEIIARGGVVEITAMADPARKSTTNDPVPRDDAMRVQIDDGSRIDVSGNDVQLAMSRNIIDVELRGNELRDSPSQRDGVLRGESVSIDIRTLDENGRIPLADVSGALNGIKRSVAERTGEGGTVSIVSDGDIVMQQGAQIDVSGGSIAYADGIINTSKLVSEGRIYDISNADPNRRYDGILQNGRAEFQSGYIEGKDAGTVQFAARGLVLDGSLNGSVVNGPHQRGAAQQAQGGQLIIGLPTESGQAAIRSIKNFGSPLLLDFLAPGVAFGNTGSGTQLGIDDVLPDGSADLRNQLMLTTEYLRDGGFNRTQVYSNGRISVAENAPITLTAGGELLLTGRDINVQSDISAPAGEIAFSVAKVDPKVEQLAEGANAQQRLEIGDGVSLSARGLWTNDMANFTAVDDSAVVSPDGGSIRLKMDDAGVLALGDGVSMDVSAGAWLQADGDLQAGKGGDIAIITNAQDVVFDMGADLSLKGAALVDGGSLSLNLPALNIDGGQDAASVQAQDALWATRRQVGSAEYFAGTLVETMGAGLDETQREQLSQGFATVIADRWQNNASLTLTDLRAELVVAMDAALGGSNSASPGVALGRALADPALAGSVSERLILPAAMFQRGGFDDYQITANVGGLTVLSAAEIRPQMQNLVLDRRFRSQASGSDMASFTETQLLLPSRRRAVDISLNLSILPNVKRPDDSRELILEAGSQIITDPGARVALASGTGGQIVIDGRIDAPAGEIDVSLKNRDTQDFNPYQMIWLGADSVLSTQGIAVLEPDPLGLRRGEILDGGRISLSSAGYILAADGSRLDVSAASAALDLPDGRRLRRQPVAGAAGDIRLSAAEGILLDGELRGVGTPGAGPRGGSLSVKIDRELSAQRLAKGNNLDATIIASFGDVWDAPRQILVRQSEQAETPQAFDGTAVSGSTTDASLRAFDTALRGTDLNGKVIISAQQIDEGGFDSLQLENLTGEIRFQGDTDTASGVVSTVDLSLARSIRLNASLLATDGGNVNLLAPYITLGAGRTPTPTQAGDAAFNLNANFIDLAGSTVLQGFNQARLSASGDIRLRGQVGDANARGGLAVSGALSLSAAQIYGATLADFTLSVEDIPADAETGTAAVSGIIDISSNGADTAPVLSAGSRLTLQADTIRQGGVLKAPFGEITFNARQQLTLTDGSLTSTTGADQRVPFGRIQNGTDWYYFLANNDNINNARRVFAEDGQNLPQQRIELNGEQVAIDDGAQLDMRGGGDLYAYEWIPGPGGSVDALSAENAGNTFAILPQLGNAVAPFDPQESRGWDLQAGDSVRLLSDAVGLLAGEYALLPARYALLPGAYLVTATTGYQDLQPGQQAALLDGAPVVAGYRTVAGTDIRDGRNSGFVIRPGEYSRQLAEYRDTFASSFVPQRAEQLEVAVPRLPVDAGSLVIAGQTAIKLEGELLASAADGGRGAQVDIIADRLRVVNAPEGSTGAVELLAASLNNLAAESLLLGGRRHEDSHGTHLQTVSTEVSVADGVRLALPEMLLTATDSVNVGAGVTLDSGSGDPASAGRRFALDGDSALLAVSSSPLAAFTRTGSAGGQLNVAEGAVLRGRSMILDAIDTQMAGSFDVLGDTLSLGASQISLGEAGESLSGLVLDQQQLDGFAGINLQLRSLSSLDLYGPVSVVAENLLIDAGAVVGHVQAGDSATLQAMDTLRLSNVDGAVVASGVSDDGSLQLQAQRIVLAGGDVGLQGFADVTLESNGAIVGDGGGGLHTSGDLLLAAERLTGESGAETHIEAAGRVDIRAALQPGLADDLVDELARASTVTDGIGAQLNIRGSRIDHAGRIQMASGSVELQATGTGAEDGVTLLAGSEIDVSGVSLMFSDLDVGTPGGQVILRADAGDVTQQAGALIDVSGTTEGGGSDAGSLKVIATQGQMSLQGELRGTAQAGYRSGVFEAHARAIGEGGFDALNQALNAGGFAERRALRLSNGDVTIRGVVSTRDFSLAMDAGAITLEGGIDASGETGGRVAMFARDGLVLTSTARIDASASAEGEDGGEVTLGTSQGFLSFEQNGDGSQRPVIDVSAGAGGVGGEVVLRTPQARQAQRADGSPAVDGNDRPLFIIDDEQGNAVFPMMDAAGAPVDGQGNAVFDPGSNDTVAIAALDVDIAGAASTVVEAVRIYKDTDGVITAGEIGTGGTWYRDASNFMSQSAAIRAQLDVAADDSGFHLTPGLEIRSDGDLTLDADWNLADWRFDGEPGSLTLRAGGNLLINADINDGFRDKTVTSGFTSSTVSELLNERSWNYRLVAGSDLPGADPMALAAAGLIADGVGNVALGDGNRVRTGTGNIQIATAADLTFGDVASTIYTAGTPSGWELDRAWLDAPTPGTPQKYLPTNGGDLRIVARGDVIGPGTETDKAQFVDEWLLRQKAAEENSLDLGAIKIFLSPEEMAGWWIDFGAFEQNLAAFGGGDVEITAGGDITRISASVPTTGAVDAASGELQRVGRGNLQVAAGGDILSGIFFVGDGDGRIRAQGKLASVRRNAAGTFSVDTVLALMGGKMDVYARGDVGIQAAINPTLLNRKQSLANISYASFDANTRLDLRSLTGDVQLASSGPAIDATTSSNKSGALQGVFRNMDIVARLYPGSLGLTALQGDVLVKSSSVLLPAPQGNLVLLANDDVRLDAGIVMSDSDPDYITSYTVEVEAGQILKNARLVHVDPPLHLQDSTSAYVVARTGNVQANGNLVQIPKPTVISAGRDVNDIQLDVQHLRASDVTRIEAGRDIVQRTNTSVISVSGPGHVAVSAGRNIDLGPSAGIETTGNLRRPALPAGGASISVAVGLGDSRPDYASFFEQYQNYYLGGSLQQQALLTLMAGRSASRGLDSLALLQAFMRLPGGEQTAIFTELGLVAEDRVRMEAVLQRETQIERFVDVLSVGGTGETLSAGQAAAIYKAWSPDDQQALRDTLGLELAEVIDVVAAIEFRAELVQYTAALSDTPVQNFDDARTVFASLDNELQRPMIEQMFYRELRSTGRQANARGDADFSRGYEAIATLFPEGDGASYDGNLSLFFSKIYTLDGGDINLLVPGGLVNAGLANQPANAPNKKASELGIVAQGPGRVSAFTRGDFQVNQSRVFSLQGGDILMWSSESNIDAGRGTKTAISAPPPQITVDVKGNVQVSFANSIAGSGIRAISTDPERKPGDVDLIAPVGVVDAGDAGIGGENLNIAAQQVIGANNIDIGGVAAGVPVADSGALSGSLSGVSDVGSSVSKSAENSVADVANEEMSDTPLADAAFSFLEVFVIGLGEDEKGS